MTRVDVSETFSADQLWFRRISVCFSAVHYLKNFKHGWFSSEQRWKRKFSELRISTEHCYFNADFLWNSAEQRSFSWIQEDIFQCHYQFFFEIRRSTSISRYRIVIFSPYCWEEVNRKKSICSAFLRANDRTQTHFFDATHSNDKTDMVQVYKNISLLSGMKFRHRCKKFEFSL